MQRLLVAGSLHQHCAPVACKGPRAASFSVVELACGQTVIHCLLPGFFGASPMVPFGARCGFGLFRPCRLRSCAVLGLIKRITVTGVVRGHATHVGGQAAYTPAFRKALAPWLPVFCFHLALCGGWVVWCRFFGWQASFLLPGLQLPKELTACARVAPPAVVLRSAQPISWSNPRKVCPSGGAIVCVFGSEVVIWRVVLAAM